MEAVPVLLLSRLETVCGEACVVLSVCKAHSRSPHRLVSVLDVVVLALRRRQLDFEGEVAVEAVPVLLLSRLDLGQRLGVHLELALRLPVLGRQRSCRLPAVVS